MLAGLPCRPSRRQQRPRVPQPPQDTRHMKITCQACQSKYTIADDKIQGKVAKIRCRKCGATVLVDASAGGRGNGSVAPPAQSDVWLVSVADGDQRPMQL